MSQWTHRSNVTHTLRVYVLQLTYYYPLLKKKQKKIHCRTLNHLLLERIHIPCLILLVKLDVIVLSFKVVWDLMLLTSLQSMRTLGISVNRCTKWDSKYKIWVVLMLVSFAGAT